jgi:hypothetical protein
MWKSGSLEPRSDLQRATPFRAGASSEVQNGTINTPEPLNLHGILPCKFATIEARARSLYSQNCRDILIRSSCVRAFGPSSRFP